MDLTREDEKNIRHAMGLITECMVMNKIKSEHGVHAMINIIASQMKDHYRERFIKVLEEMVDDR